MVDLSGKGSECEDMSGSKYPDGGLSSEENQLKKTCADCGTTKTPLWRGGPAGPKSLCNACGIRSRKKRRALLGLNKTEEKKGKRSSNNNSHRNSSSENNKLGDSLKRRLLGLGREVMLQRAEGGDAEEGVGRGRTSGRTVDGSVL
ncbi:hypothetical protein L1049_016520 [Liquidambar formosana]|uniref:GATA-type domain-containing protein n=1 Tax=Liquidambar formosana TaxID=63359 RepID=A0AAP0S0Y2_LIQFO